MASAAHLRPHPGRNLRNWAPPADMVLNTVRISQLCLSYHHLSSEREANPTSNAYSYSLEAMAFSLKGKVALVTAGSAGLGAAVVRALASESMRIVVNYSANYERANDLVEDLSRSFPASAKDHENRFTTIKADLEKRAEIIRLVEETFATMGRLDVVVSNGGWTKFSNFADLDAGVEEQDWDRCFNFNVKSHLFLMHAAKKYLDETEGAFITTASLAGVKPSGSSLVWKSSSSIVTIFADHFDMRRHMP